MFTGIIAHVGRVRAADADPRGGVALTLFAPTLIAEGVEPKDSVCVNGVCLTVVRAGDDQVAFDVVPETLRRANLSLRPGDLVNLEPSLRLGDRLGGHIVYGHVDAAVAIRMKRPEGQGYRLSLPRVADLARFIVDKGCVALDGVSLTVAGVDGDAFEVALIPETAARTTLGQKGAGSLVNLEVDPIARYALGAAQAYDDHAGVTSDELAWAYEI